MTPSQLVTAVLSLLLVAFAGTIVVYLRGRPRRLVSWILGGASVVVIAAWTGYGSFQDVFVDVDSADPGPKRPKARQHRPFHFHDFVHYYVGPKYFRELGYLGLYDCITLADRELAEEAHVSPRIRGWVRNLDDVLTDKSVDAAIETCVRERRPGFSDARWAEFKGDIRGLQRLVGDEAWPSVVFDAGFNPPPTPVVLTSTVTNLIPIWSGNTQTFLVATMLDLLLLAIAYVVVGRTFGGPVASVFAIFFGATYLSHYTWNGGSVLRFSWLVEIVLGLCALKRERWRLAGAILAVAALERIFPLAFGLFAAIPLALRARSSERYRRALKDYAITFAATGAALFVLGTVVYGFSAWRTFFDRIGRHGDVYYVMHIGLKKVLTYRDWVPHQNFGGHEGLVRFKLWNYQLRDTWREMRLVAVPVQLALFGGAAIASLRRRPFEAALLGGVVCMFTFALPANYYYSVLALIPALLLRAAATAPSPEARHRSFAGFAFFTFFWAFTCVANQLNGDLIIVGVSLSTALLAFLLAWLACWTDRATLRTFRTLPIVRSFGISKS